MLISLIHATRGRKDVKTMKPPGAPASVTQQSMFSSRDEWWIGRAIGKINEDYEHIYSMDDDDPLLDDQEMLAKISPSRLITGMPPENNAAWNRAYEATDPSSKVIVQVSDDFEAPEGWDHIILNRLEHAGGLDKPLVLGVADPHFTPPYSGDGLMTIIICTRAYLEKVGGFLLYPEYLSVFSDNDFTDAAALNQCLVDGYDLCFPHHWHGSDVDPLRDETHCRHMTTECNQFGSQVWGARMWSGFPDVKVHDGPVDWKKNLCPPQLDIGKTLVEQREERIKRFGKGHNIENLPFPESDPRAAWIAGDYKTARDGIEEIMAKYHLTACDGRFLMHGAHFIWYKCTEILGDKPLYGVREVHK